MNYDKLSMFCIYPHDRTTKFLDRIIHALNREMNDSFHCYKVKLNNTSHDICIDILNKLDNKTILFLGHGRSDKLFGGCGDNADDDCFVSSEATDDNIKYYKNENFININNVGVFKNNIVISLSCYSNRVSKNSIGSVAIEKGAKCFVGFGDTLTDYRNDIDKNRQMTEREIGIFKGCIVCIIKTALLMAYRDKLTVSQFVDLVKVLTHKTTHSIIIKRKGLKKSRYKIAKHLYWFQDDIQIMGNQFEQCYQ